MQTKIMTTVLVVTVAGMTTVHDARAQCSPFGTGARVNQNYQADPNGAFRLVENPGNFTACWYDNWSPCAHYGRVPLADPTIVKVGSWYYVTGTCDHYSTGNFAIYKSQNLYQWSFHATVFPDNQRSGALITLNNGRTFNNLWAPQFYIDPTENGGNPVNVWISFTATEDGDGGWCTAGQNGDGQEYQTAFTATCAISSFQSGGPFANPAMNRAHEPMPYIYKVNNAQFDPIRLDGGAAQSAAQGTFRTIPVTGDPDLIGPNCGNLEYWGARLGHRCMGTNTYIALDTHVFFDSAPGQNNKRWMLYTWSVANTGDTSFNGNHVAAYPMLNNAWMDALATGKHLPLAFRDHVQHFPTGHPRNGHSVANGTYHNTYAWAEAPAAFRWNGYTYLIYSRNGWNSPAYGIFSRKVTGAFETLALKDGIYLDWDNATTPETIVARASNPNLAYGPSYGHGEIFMGPGNKPYLIFHAKQQGTWNAGLGREVYPDGYSGRTAYFKELNFDGSGNIVSLSDWPGVCGQTTVGRFLVPW